MSNEERLYDENSALRQKLGEKISRDTSAGLTLGNIEAAQKEVLTVVQDLLAKERRDFAIKVLGHISALEQTLGALENQQALDSLDALGELVRVHGGMI